jgi:tRNA A37 threonylcarbamoyladenosine modification protein TsaB
MENTTRNEVTTVQGQVYVQNTTEQEQHTEYPAISVPDFFETVEELSEFIYLANTQQPVLNQKLHKGAIELVIVVQVFIVTSSPCICCFGKYPKYPLLMQNN